MSRRLGNALDSYADDLHGSMMSVEVEDLKRSSVPWVPPTKNIYVDDGLQMAVLQAPVN